MIQHPFLMILIVAIAILIGWQSLSQTKVTHYAQEKPEFHFRDFFDGPVEAWGVFTDRSGVVQKRFTVHMKGHWIDDEGVLEERFEYSDGTTQDRVWKIKALPGGRFTASAGDILGQASGEESGNAIEWRYTLVLPLFGRDWHMNFDDWMYLVNSDTLINKATMSKWGIRLGEVTLFFKKTGMRTHVTQSAD